MEHDKKVRLQAHPDETIPHPAIIGSLSPPSQVLLPTICSLPFFPLSHPPPPLCPLAACPDVPRVTFTLSSLFLPSPFPSRLPPPFHSPKPIPITPNPHHEPHSLRPPSRKASALRRPLLVKPVSTPSVCPAVPAQSPTYEYLGTDTGHLRIGGHCTALHTHDTHVETLPFTTALRSTGTAVQPRIPASTRRLVSASFRFASRIAWRALSLFLSLFFAHSHSSRLAYEYKSGQTDSRGTDNSSYPYLVAPTSTRAH